MVSFEFTVQDPNGLHARPAGQLIKEAMKCKSKVTIKNGDKSADAKRLFNVMALGVKGGDVLTVEVEGESETQDAENFKAFVTENI